uniref:THAP-type domain-containing protein n=2 Tax=Heliothis virescens TaxID=7102 RepID=A0A2A4JY71_HELVI
MPSDKHCCVPGCKTGAEMHAVLHKFPNPEKDRERFNSWLYAIGGDILGLPNEHIYKFRRVCNLHFEDRYMCRNNRISNIAVPRLHLTDLLSPKSKFSGRKPLQEIVNQPTPSTSTDPDSVTKEPQLTTTSQIPFIPTVKRKSVQRNFGKKVYASGLSMREKELRMKIICAKNRIYKLKNKVKNQYAQIKEAKKLVSNPAVLDTLKNCTNTAKLLMRLQLREDSKKKEGRRFSLQEKISALSILKQSPKAYRYLRKIFILPTAQTLVKLVQQCNIRPGLNKNIMQHITKKAAKMNDVEKLCIVLFDEVALKAHLSYNARQDKVTGVVDNGQQRQIDFADHAQVFMVRGLLKNYKQAVYYTFSASATKGPELARQIKEVVIEVQKAGLIVVGTVCDQGTNNRQAINLLINETRGEYLRRGEQPKENVILINDNEIVPLYDPPHLIKGMRNNLISKNLTFKKDGELKTAKWSHLLALNKENPGYKGFRLIPKLTESHVNPEKMNKMKVKYATQIFSRTVAANMGYLADKGILPLECKDTADLFLFLDHVFDSVNGSYRKNRFAKPLLGPVTPISPHKKFWTEAKQILKSMQFITSTGKVETVPTIKNWVWTLDGIQVLINNLESKFGVTSVWLRHLNQDPLENFFGAIRSHGCRNVNPTCDQFESAFATLTINNLSSVHTQAKNCQNDFCEALFSLVLNENVEHEATSTCTVDFESIININLETIENKENNPRVLAPLQYISGYFLKKIKTNVFKNCSVCKNDFIATDQLEYINYREYAGRRWLCTPSYNLINLISNCQDIINHILKENLETYQLKCFIKTCLLTIINFDFIKCQTHKNKIIDYLVNFVVRFMCFNYCKLINKILTGRKTVEDEDDKVQIKANKYHKKCFKRKIERSKL